MLAIGSGMVALCFASSAQGWGVSQDYLAAVLWGGMVADGIKLVTGLVA